MSELGRCARSIDELRERMTALLRGRRRVIVGIAGAPGAGKSTIACGLADALGSSAVVVPMDGFHLSNRVLLQAGLRDRKGAPETFDAAGYVALLRRLREPGDVYAPAFDRRLDEPVAASILVPSSANCIVTEGNYLLSDVGAFAEVRELLDETWWVDLPDDVRLRRLVARHEEFGMSHDAAVAWAGGVDQRNADLVAASAHRADVRVMLAD